MPTMEFDVSSKSDLSENLTADKRPMYENGWRLLKRETFIGDIEEPVAQIPFKGV